MAIALSTHVSATQLTGRKHSSASRRPAKALVQAQLFGTTASAISLRRAGRPAARCAASSDDESTGSQGSPSGSQGGSEMDFDAYLTLFAEKYEASENKGAVAGYSIGALVAFIFIEYFIHLPVFNVLLGFPLQLLGVLMAPYLGVRYLMDGKDIKDDVGTAITSVTDKLPGLK
eukprot:jgi/Tetstr1/454567/TSEL_041462.t1